MKLSWDNFYWGVWRKFKAWEPIYWLRTHTINRYHLVDCRSPHNGYSWGYCDITGKMLYANFNMLIDFVEKENVFHDIGWGMKAGFSVDWDSEEAGEERKHTGKEIKKLYWWWKSGRAEERKHVETLWEWDKCHWHFIPCPSEKYPEQSQMIFDNKEAWDLAGEMEEYLDKKDDEMLERLIKLRHWLWT